MNENEASPPQSITSEIYAQWRSPSYGSRNPERMNNPLWEWLIETRINAYQATQALNGPSSFDAGPAWCFDRFGQSTTEMPDGSTLLIGGEHEDYYDPDFYIYNDLVVMGTAGETEIYGYPRAEFPPTDFHTATLTDQGIVMIGNLGYQGERRFGQTQILLMGNPGWRVSAIETSGKGPGWIHDHQADLTADGVNIRISGGKVASADSLGLTENIDEWLLDLNRWYWERVTDRRWLRFELFRKDKNPLHLFKLGILYRHREAGMPDQIVDILVNESELETELGGPLRLDLIPSIYRPSIPHELVPENEDEFNVHRVLVEGVQVRYVEGHESVQVMVEGELPSEIVEQIHQELTETLEALEQSPIEVVQIPHL